MDSLGLGWLANHGWPGCLMFARGVSWVFVIEEDIPPQGLRPEVLRPVSADGGEAVALYQDIGKFNHEFAHSYDGEGPSAAW